jgi:hypothetical protein
LHLFGRAIFASAAEYLADMLIVVRRKRHHVKILDLELITVSEDRSQALATQNPKLRAKESMPASLAALCVRAPVPNSELIQRHANRHVRALHHLGKLLKADLAVAVQIRLHDGLVDDLHMSALSSPQSNLFPQNVCLPAVTADPSNYSLPSSSTQ